MATMPPIPHQNPVETPDVAGQYGKVLGLQQMMGAQKIQQQEIQKNQADLNDRDAMTKAMQSWDGKDPQQLIQSVIKNKGSANAVLGLQQKVLAQKEQYSKIAEQDATTGAKNLESMKIKNDTILGSINALKDVPDEELVPRLTQTVQDLVQKGILNPQEAQQAAQIVQVGDPAKIRPALDVFGKLHMSQSQQMEAALKESEVTKNTSQGAEAQQKADQLVRQNAATQLAQASDQRTYDQIRGKMPYGLASQFPGKFDKQKILQMGMSPDQQVTTGLEGAKLAETKRHNLATEGQLTPEAIKMAADQFAATGKLPDVGRNNAARAQIINQASLDHPNIALNSAEYKANLESLKGLQKNMDSVVAFENTAKKNLDLFLTQAKNVVDSGSPLLNKPLRSIAKGSLGSADQAAYDAARQVAVNEIAKVTSSPGLTGVLSDSARHEVDNFNPGNATLAQTYKVAQVLTQDMANRHESYDQQIQAIKNRIGKGASAKPNTPEQPAGDNPFAQFGGVKH